MVLVDRSYPVDYEYRGVNVKIDFQWGADDNPVPRGLRIFVDNEGNPVVAMLEEAKYSSFEQAVSRGIDMAKADIDRILGPDPNV
ncbi:MAG: hypothetical protein WCA48_29170 [Pseudomonas gingeri]